MASALRFEVRQTFERDLPPPRAGAAEDILSPQLVVAAAAVRASVHHAARTLTVTRGALGTTAATHADASSVVRWDPPGLVRALTIAETENRLLQVIAGYSRTSKTSTGAKSVSVE